MRDVTEEDAFTALTEWWDAAGVDVDRELLAALRTPKVHRDAEGARRPVAQLRIRPGSEDFAAWTGLARAAAATAHSLAELKAAIEGFDGSPLKAGAENTVVFDGIEGASLMVIGEGPGAEEDRTGLPFVGRAGQLLDRMLKAIGRSRKTNALITNVNYWRPPGNRNPEASELAVCRPFVDRMIELAKPKLIIAAGGVPAVSLLASKDGIMKLRGKEFVLNIAGGYAVPLIPILHPAYLLRRPQDKSRAWRDLMVIQERLEALDPGANTD
jgi:DNA polymerase